MKLTDPTQTLAALIRCPSVTPKEGGALTTLAEMLDQLGFRNDRVTFSDEATPDVENLYSRLGSGGPHLMFAGHTDVVPVGDEAAWTQGPFGAEIVDGEMYGRGAVDMKGGIACFVSALARLIERKGAPEGSVSLLITGDEEGPSINGTEKLLAYARAKGESWDAAVVGEPTTPAEMGDMIFNGSSGYKLLDDASDPRAAFVFEGVSANVGDIFGEYGVDRVYGGAAGFEIDRYNPGNGAPRHTLHLATSDELKPKIEDVKMGVLPLTILYHPSDGSIHAQADLVFFETPNGGAMFSTGSITWFSSTLENNFDNDVATITRNVIHRFLESAPLNSGNDTATDDTSRAPGNPEYDRMD